MSRRAPLQFGALGIPDRLAGGDIDLRLLMLHDFDRNVILVEPRIRLKDTQGIRRRAERIHEGQRQWHTKPLSCGQHLTDDDIQETHLSSLVPAYRKQRFGTGQTHRRSQAAIELDEGRFTERLHGFLVVDGLVDIMEAGDIEQRFDIVFTDPCRFGALHPHVIQMTELCDRHLAHAMVPHHLCAMLSMFICRHVITLSPMTAHKCSPHTGGAHALPPGYR